MSELAGLELRREALEALGWHWYEDENQPGYILAVSSDNEELQQYARERNLPEAGIRLECMSALPAIESDSAVSEPMFLEFCAKNDYTWVLSEESGHYEVCWFIKRQDFPLHQGTSEGATPSEARARAIVAAGATAKRKEKA